MTAPTPSRDAGVHALERTLIESAWATALLRRAVDLARLGMSPLEAVVTAALDCRSTTAVGPRVVPGEPVVAEHGWLVIAALRTAWSDDERALRWLVAGEVPRDGMADARAPLLALAAGDTRVVRRALADLQAATAPAVAEGEVQ